MVSLFSVRRRRGEIFAPRYFARPNPVRGVAITFRTLHGVYHDAWRALRRVDRGDRAAHGYLRPRNSSNSPDIARDYVLALVAVGNCEGERRCGETGVLGGAEYQPDGI